MHLLEADLLDPGWLLSPTLRDAPLRVDTADLVAFGATLVADYDAYRAPAILTFPCMLARESS